MKDYVDARDDAMESRVNAKLGALPTKGTVWGAVATAVAIVLAVLAFGGDRFDSGMSAGTIVQAQRAEQQKTDQSQDAKLELMNQKLDILIKQTSEK